MNLGEWLGEDNVLGQDIWKRKYQYNDETFEQWVSRISGDDPEVAKLIKEKKFLFGGRILANRGLNHEGRKVSLSNCYVISAPEDNIESIFETSSKLARTYSYGGGCGIDISKLAPHGAKVRNAAKETSGAVSFMDLFSLTTELIGQNGRRGALMISMSVDHPDIIEFIKVKTDLNRVTKANISVRVTNDFMEAVKADKVFKLHYIREATGEVIEKTVEARDVMRLIAEVNWDYGEPGMLFWDRISNYNLLATTPKFEYAGTNPCFRGDTEVAICVKGATRYATIESLVGKRPEVYCMDSSGEIMTMRAEKVWKTRKNVQLVKVMFMDNSYINCTPDHLFYVEGRNWIMAKDLKPSTKLYSCDVNHEYGYDESYVVKNVYGVTQRADVYDMIVPGVHNFMIRPKGSRSELVGLVVANCGEEPLPAGGSCLLGSINLSEFVRRPFTPFAHFDYDEFEECVKTSVKALNDVLDEGLELHPLLEQRESVARWRQIGLGIMGLADMLIKLGIRYGSDTAVEISHEIGSYMSNTAIMESSLLAKELGPYSEYIDDVRNTEYFKTNVNCYTDAHVKQFGLRNSQLLTIAPTGTLSTMLGISGGIEPIFSYSYTRKTESLYGEDKYYTVYTKIVKDFIEANPNCEPKNLPEYFIDAMKLNYLERVDMQAAWQSHIDACISSTVNVPEDFTVEDVEKMYQYAWNKGCKGITLFRNNCKRLGILTPDSDKVKEDIETIGLTRGEIREVDDTAIGRKRKLMTGCGTLHCEAFFDRNTGELLETYLSKGSTGGCNNFMVGLSRMISLSARSGVPIDKIVDQLNSTGVCPSYAVRRATIKDTSKGSCCPMAVGNALLDMYHEIQETLNASSISSIESLKHAEAVVSKDSKCPECGEKLSFEGGCNICKNCGYSRCS